MSSPTPDVTFEEALSRLEGVVGRLESGELSLEESLRCFEEGISLQRRCISQLDAAQQRIEVLQDAGVPTVTPGRTPASDDPGNGLSLALEESHPRG